MGDVRLWFELPEQLVDRVWEMGYEELTFDENVNVLLDELRLRREYDPPDIDASEPKLELTEEQIAEMMEHLKNWKPQPQIMWGPEKDCHGFEPNISIFDSPNAVHNNY